MPEQIVSEFRLIYRNVYMQNSLSLLLGEEQSYAAFIKCESAPDEILGFPGSYIYVKYDGPDVPRIWASNQVKLEENESCSAVIILAPRLYKEDQKKKKEVMAHEWIEAMVRIREGKDTKRTKSITGQEQLSILLASLEQPCLQQDDPDFLADMHKALRALLVSAHSLKR